MAITTTIKVYRGDELTLRFRFKVPRVTTGETYAFSIAQEANSATKIVDERACTADSETVGRYSVAITSTDTDRAPGVYHWDIARTNTGNARVVGSGAFIITADARLP